MCNSVYILNKKYTIFKINKLTIIFYVLMQCDIEECVFKDLQIVSDAGAVDVQAFSKFLDNMTRMFPEWTSAKARVVTTCLSRPITDYEADCEINKILSCTFDVLTEVCFKKL